MTLCYSIMSAFGLPAQPVDATQALNLSAGVSNCKVWRGRSFSWRATMFRWACECTDKSVPFGKYCLSRQKDIEGEKGLPPDAAGRAIDEYLSVLDDAAFGAATQVTPKFISPSDPAARWTGAHGGQAFLGYSTNYLIDTDHTIIVDVEATTAIRQAEVLAAKSMIDRSMQRFDLYPAKLMSDSATGRPRCSAGWSMITASNRTSPCSTSRSAKTVPSRVRTSPTIMLATSISVLTARR
jgi:hypothetical protein